MLAFALAAGCRGDGNTGSGQSEPESTSEALEVGATLEGTTVDEPAPTTSGDSTGDTGSTTSTGGDTSGPASSSEGTSSGSDATSSSSEGTSSSSEGTSSSTTDDPSTDTGGSDTGETSECTFSESFQGLPDGSDWPAPWIPLDGVMLADVQGGRGRLLPITGPYALARMFVPLGPSCVDVEGTFTFELTDGLTPGVGLYLRHNGGFLDQTEPPGQGYVAFIQAFGVPGTGIGLWRELDGVETILAPYTPAVIVPGIVHAVRFRVTQEDGDTTRLRTRVWPVEGMEPLGWHVNLTDDSPSLQNVGGGVVIDVWSQLQAGMAADVFIDDITVGPAP